MEVGNALVCDERPGSTCALVCDERRVDKNLRA